jgi:hypothetical protein
MLFDLMRIINVIERRDERTKKLVSVMSSSGYTSDTSYTTQLYLEMNEKS